MHSACESVVLDVPELRSLAIKEHCIPRPDMRKLRQLVTFASVVRPRFALAQHPRHYYAPSRVVENVYAPQCLGHRRGIVAFPHSDSLVSK